MFSYCPGLTRRVWYPGMGYRGLHLQHVLTWTPKVAKATSVAANEEGCYGEVLLQPGLESPRHQSSLTYIIAQVKFL